jgi:hypothetical protein
MRKSQRESRGAYQEKIEKNKLAPLRCTWSAGRVITGPYGILCKGDSISSIFYKDYVGLMPAWQI